MRQIAPLVVLLVMVMGSATLDAAIYRVGSCSGSTHATLDSAWNAVGEGTGHVINLCQGNHTSPALIPTERHQNITLKSLSGKAADTKLIASNGTLFGLIYHPYTISNLTVEANFSSQSPAIFRDSIIKGTITTTGTLTIESSSVNGNIKGENGVTITNTDQLISGNVIATNGTITVTGGTIGGNVDTQGNSQKIFLTGTTVSGYVSTGDTISITGGSVAGALRANNGGTVTNTSVSGNITVTNGLITINSSTVGNPGSPITITNNNYIQINDSTIWGDITAPRWGENPATIMLNPNTHVYGYCDPFYRGGGVCQTDRTNCSPYIGRATINEINDGRTGRAFIEVKLLDTAIPASVYKSWTLTVCEGNCANPTPSRSLSAANTASYPWLVLDPPTDIKTKLDSRMLIRLNDGTGRAIDYLSINNHSTDKPTSCKFVYDIDLSSNQNPSLILRKPDGVGEWIKAGPGNSGENPTEGGSNDGNTGGSCKVHLQLSVPNHIAGAPTSASLQANILAGATGCFDGAKEIFFYSERINPTTTAPGEPRALRLNSTAVATASPGTALIVAFSGNSATVPLTYPDAGLLRLHACHEGACSFADFVARPAGFTLAVPANPGTVAADGPVFRAAGADFQILVTAIGANGERLPNFGREQAPATVQLQTTLLAPVGGESPGLTGGFGGFGLNCEDDSATWGTACGIFNWSEVGAIAITPRIAGGNYLNVGPDIVGPNSVDVGRFIPHHFTLDNAAIEHRSALACSPASDFTYLGEDLSANFKLQARALDGSLTRNYTGNFARLPAQALNPAALYNGENLSSELSQQAAQTHWLLGTGDIKLTLQMKRTTSGTDFTPAGPWTGLQLGLQPRDADGVQLANDHLTLDLNNDGNNDHGLLGETDLRFGRLLLDNALGSELGPLRLPATAQYWNGSTWVNNTADSCTRLSLATQVRLNDSLSGTTTVPVGSGSSQITSGELQLIEGRGFIEFSAPNAVGYIDVELLLDAGGPGYSFLQDHLDADGNYDQNPRGRASWGLYRGNNSTILMLEAQP